MAVTRDMLAGLPTRDVFATFFAVLAPIMAVVLGLAFYRDAIVATGIVTHHGLYVIKEYVYIAVVAVAIFSLVVARAPKPWDVLGFRRCDVDWLVRAFLLAILIYWIQDAVNTLLATLGYTEWVDAFRRYDRAVLRGSSLLVGFALCLVTAVFTPLVIEVFARGLVFAWMRRNLDFSISAIASSIVFGVVHVEVVKYGQAIAFGLIAAWLYERAGSLWAPIVLHVTVNGAYVVSLLR